MMFEDEDEEFEEHLPSSDCWTLVGQHMGCDGTIWEDAPREIVEAARLLEDLECSGITEEIDWDELVGGLPTLFRLAGDDFDDYPLILDFAEFEELSDLFLVIDLDEVKNLYVSKDEDERLQPLLAEFAELARRLKAYPPLRDVMTYKDD